VAEAYISHLLVIIYLHKLRTIKSFKKFLFRF